jgi:hypothetical protein
MRKAVLLLLIITLLNSCSDVEDLKARDQVVVESYLVVGQVPTVKVSSMALFESTEEAHPILDLDITIESNGTSYSLTAIDSGLYQNNDLIVQEGQDYNLLFTYAGRTISAVARALGKPEDFRLSASSITVSGSSGGGFPPSFPSPIKMYWDNSEADQYLAVIENIESDPEPINDFGDDDDRPTFIFRNQPTNGDTQDIGARQFQYYGLHRVILFHITPDYAALYDNTGSTSQNITTPPTNIGNGLGIFTAVNSDTLFLRVQ